MTALYERQLKLVTLPEQRVEVLLSLGRVFSRADRLARARDRELRARARDQSRTRRRARGAGPPARNDRRRRRRAHGDRGAGGQGHDARGQSGAVLARRQAARGARRPRRRDRALQAGARRQPERRRGWRSRCARLSWRAATSMPRCSCSIARSSRPRATAPRRSLRERWRCSRATGSRTTSARRKPPTRVDLRPDESRRADDPRRSRLRRQAPSRSSKHYEVLADRADTLGQARGGADARPLRRCAQPDRLDREGARADGYAAAHRARRPGGARARGATSPSSTARRSARSSSTPTSSSVSATASRHAARGHCLSLRRGAASQRELRQGPRAPRGVGRSRPVEPGAAARPRQDLRSARRLGAGRQDQVTASRRRQRRRTRAALDRDRRHRLVRSSTTAPRPPKASSPRSTNVPTTAACSPS